jgi:hypothetical protein
MEIDRLDEASKLFEESIIPLCKDKTGYKGAYFLADRKTGKCNIITVWDNEKNMMATEKSLFFQEQVIKLMRFFTSNPIREAYEVIVED